MKPIRDWSECRQIKCFDKNLLGFLEQPPEYVFTHGACHAFALELRELLKRKGATELKLYMIASSSLPPCEDEAEAPLARHVFVSTLAGGIDVYGIQHAGEFLKDWRKADDDVSQEVKISDWLTQPKPESETESVVGLWVEASFLLKARQLASKIIQENPTKYGLP